MRITWTAIIALMPFLSMGQPTQVISSTPVERGPHHTRWETVRQTTDDQGVVQSVTGAYVELASGLNRVSDDGTAWVPASSEIELLDGGGAIARQTAHKVVFSANINTPDGAVHVLTPDGKLLKTRILGLNYYSAMTGENAFIAELKDSIGEVRGNQVIYRDAFDGVLADVILTVSLAGFQQDVVLRSQPPGGELLDLLGFDRESARLEVWTEVFDPPVPVQRSSVIHSESDPLTHQLMVEPVFGDTGLDFGAMQIGSGRAFLTEDSGLGAEHSTLVGKSWITTPDNRTFLVEAVRFPAIEPLLRTLPVAAADDVKARAARIAARKAPRRNEFFARLPAVPPARKAAGESLRLLAKLDEPASAGVVLDYVLVSSSSDYTFASGVTHYVKAAVNLSGTTTFLQNSVIKLTNATSGVMLNFQGPVVFDTTPYAPVIFTGKDDDTVGVTISESTGTPSGYYGEAYLNLTFGAGTTGGLNVSNAIIRYANIGVHMPQGRHVNIDNVQFVKGDYGVFNKETMTLRNVLFYQIHRVFAGQFTTAVTHAEHLTVHRANSLVWGTTLPDILLTNSLLISVTNNVDWVGSNVETNLSDSGIFETLGTQAHYLPEASPYRDAGTRAIDAGLAIQLMRRTTTAPILLTNAITASTNLAPQTATDTDTPDLGWHYPVADFAIDMLAVTNATLTLTNGGGACEALEPCHSRCRGKEFVDGTTPKS